MGVQRKTQWIVVELAESVLRKNGSDFRTKRSANHIENRVGRVGRVGTVMQINGLDLRDEEILRRRSFLIVENGNALKMTFLFVFLP